MKNVIIILFILCSDVCFSQKEIINKAEMCQLLSEMTKNDQKYRVNIPDDFNAKSNGLTEKEIDSLTLLQRKIDNYNTQKLIDLTNTYGWISNDRINCSDLNVWIIFRHSQKNFHEEIRKLIQKEYNAKRLAKFEYKMILHHFNNRPRRRQ